MGTQKLSTQELDRLVAAYPALAESPTVEADTGFLQQLLSIDRDLLSQLMVEQCYSPGEVVFQEGDPGDAMYLVRSGRLAVVKGDLGCLTILGYRGAGAIVGEMALLEEKARSASVVALEDTHLLKIGRASFRQLLGDESLIGMKIMGMLSGRLRESDTVRTTETVAGRQLAQQVSQLEQEKRHLLELQQVRQETSDLIVHDLRNPLSSIYASIQMLQILLPEEALAANQEILGIAGSACQSMQRLVDSLLDVTRFESAHVQLELVETNLGRLVEQVLQGAALSAKSGGVVLQADLPPDLPLITMDEGMIERVLNNLLDNAIRYAPLQTQIDVAAEIEGDQLSVSVTDTGPGIPPEDRERIFERFAQIAGGKGARGRRGFGLGLTFCQLAVEAHGGRIWVEPGPEECGSRFVFSLPLGQGQGWMI